MNYLSLLALCSVLLALPACSKNNGCCRKRYVTTTETTTTTATPAHGEEDKEVLYEQEIVEVMNNK